MKLEEIIEEFALSIEPPSNPDISSVVSDSRRVEPGSLFVAIAGAATDGLRYAGEAAQRGAAAWPRIGPCPESFPLPWARVANPRRVASVGSQRAAGLPYQRLRIAGVTGTNGKTTTAMLIAGIFRRAWGRSGFFGTVGYGWNGKTLAAARTTPEGDVLAAMMRAMVDEGVPACAMEVSSHAIALERVAGIRFDVAVFTNLTRDHLDFHETLEIQGRQGRSSSACTKPEGPAIVNVDDPWGRAMAARLAAPVFTYSPSGDSSADYRAENIEVTLSGTRFRAVGPRGRRRSRPLVEPLQRGEPAPRGPRGCAGDRSRDDRRRARRQRRGPGRMERVDAGQQYTILVDYAHTEDALRRLLSAVREITDKTIILVFGCGGDRDRGKREPMGRAAAELADIPIATSDNPRGEDPAEILKEVERGLIAGGASKYLKFVDRREAITRAIELANSRSVVVIAGKGARDHTGHRGREFRSTIGRSRRNASDPRAGCRREGERAEAARSGGSSLRGLLVRRVAVDSRRVAAGNLFVALPGARADGHDFVAEAAGRGAAAALVARRPADVPAGFPLFVVADPLDALQQLAARKRAEEGFRLAAVTGSVGKTTTKEMAAAIVSGRMRAGKTPGNANSGIGFPMAILGLPAGLEAVCGEFGMSTPGEIATLARLFRPEVGAITNVSAAHGELPRSTRSRTPWEIAQGIAEWGTPVYNAGEERLALRARRYTGAAISFGADGADVTAADVATEGLSGTAFTLRMRGEKERVRLPVPGRHQVGNALCAAAIALAWGFGPADVSAALANFTPPERRGGVFRLASGARLVDVSYNASPEAVRSVVSALERAASPGHRIAVLGEMLELGAEGPRWHRELGRFAAGRVDRLVCVSALAREIGGGALVRAAGRKIAYFTGLKRSRPSSPGCSGPPTSSGSKDPAASGWTSRRRPETPGTGGLNGTRSCIRCARRFPC
jgi:murE/murF fusion protein